MPVHSAAASARPRRPSLVRGFLRRLAQVMAMRRHRVALSKLEPHLLRDIGLTEDQARTEAARAIWDVPSHWRG